MAIGTDPLGYLWVVLGEGNDVACLRSQRPMQLNHWTYVAIAWSDGRLQGVHAVDQLAPLEPTVTEPPSIVHPMRAADEGASSDGLATSELRIGLVTTDGEPWQVWVDEVAVFDRALPLASINAFWQRFNEEDAIRLR